jgi:hypothetical protein
MVMTTFGLIHAQLVRLFCTGQDDSSKSVETLISIEWLVLGAAVFVCSGVISRLCEPKEKPLVTDK